MSAARRGQARTTRVVPDRPRRARHRRRQGPVRATEPPRYVLPRPPAADLEQLDAAHALEEEPPPGGSAPWSLGVPRSTCVRRRSRSRSPGGRRAGTPASSRARRDAGRPADVLEDQLQAAPVDQAHVELVERKLVRYAGRPALEVLDRVPRQRSRAARTSSSAVMPRRRATTTARGRSRRSPRRSRGPPARAGVSPATSSSAAAASPTSPYASRPSPVADAG
jgi:hypothetical protein